MPEVEEKPDAVTTDGSSDDDKGGLGIEDFEDVIIEGLDDVPKEKPDKKTEKEDKPPAKAVDDPMKAEIDRLNKKVTDLNKALHEERKAKKTQPAKDEAGEPLSKAELLKLFKEYKDDPDTLFQIMSYTAEQAARGASKEAVDKSKVEANRKETESFLQKNYPDVFDEDSELRKVVNKTKGEMMLENHPYGDFLGTATQLLINAPKLMKQAYDKGRDDALNGKAEKTRKEVIKESGLTPKGKGSTVGDALNLTDVQKDVAKRLGIPESKWKTYGKIVSKNAKSISVEG